METYQRGTNLSYWKRNGFVHRYGRCVGRRKRRLDGELLCSLLVCIYRVHGSHSFLSFAKARPMVLPMPNLGTLAFLTALTEECDLEVFSKHELGIMLDDLWEKEIKGLFFFDLLFYVVFCICWSLLVTKVSTTLLLLAG